MAFFKINKTSATLQRQWGIFRQDKTLSTFLIIWLVISLTATAVLIVFFPRLPLIVPLFYSRLWGDARLVSRSFLWLLPGSSFLLGVFNFGFAFRYLEDEIFLARVLGGISLVLSVLLSLAVFNIVYLML